MENQTENRYSWVIKKFSSLRAKTIYSDRFVIGGCKWHLQINPEGDRSNGCMSLFLSVANAKALTSGWSRYIRFSLTIVNQLSEELSQRLETEKRFNRNSYAYGFSNMLLLTKLHAKDGGFLVNGEMKIVVEINILEVIGMLDVVHKTEEVGANQPLKKIKQSENDAMPIFSLDQTPSVEQSIDVNGFQVLHSKVDFVKRIFEKHPDIELKFRLKNPVLRTTYMNVLLTLTEILRQSHHLISKDDLADAYVLLRTVRDAGFEVDWLEKKLIEVSEKKEKEEAYKTRMQELEEELKDLKEKVLGNKAPLKLEDV